MIWKRVGSSSWWGFMEAEGEVGPSGPPGPEVEQTCPFHAALAQEPGWNSGSTELRVPAGGRDLLGDGTHAKRNSPRPSPEALGRATWTPDWEVSGRSRYRFEIGGNGRHTALFHGHSGSRRDPATWVTDNHPGWRTESPHRRSNSRVASPTFERLPLVFSPGVYLEQRIYTMRPGPSNRGRNLLYNRIRPTGSVILSGKSENLEKRRVREGRQACVFGWCSSGGEADRSRTAPALRSSPTRQAPPLGNQRVPHMSMLRNTNPNP